MELLEKALILSLAIVGLRIVSSKGMILYCIRKPFESLTGWKKYIMKRIILCCVCMGSVWTVIIEMAYFKLCSETLLLIFIVCAMNGIIYALYEIYTKTDCK